MRDNSIYGSCVGRLKTVSRLTNHDLILLIAVFPLSRCCRVNPRCGPYTRQLTTLVAQTSSQFQQRDANSQTEESKGLCVREHLHNLFMLQSLRTPQRKIAILDLFK